MNQSNKQANDWVIDKIKEWTKLAELTESTNKEWMEKK